MKQEPTEQTSTRWLRRNPPPSGGGGSQFGPRTVNRDTGFERRSAHNAANVRFLAPSALADVERRQQLQDAMPETDLYALFAKAPTELLAQLVDWAAEQ